MKSKKIVLCINASRNRSGGAQNYILGILNELKPEIYGINKVHIWCYKSLKQLLPDKKWLVVHTPNVLEKSLFRQILWERFKLAGEIVKVGCSILFNPDAGTLCKFMPAVTMSQDMLSYEPGEIKRFGLSITRLRLNLLYYVQNTALKRANGVIFLTKYASDIIQKSTGHLNNKTIIPHGVNEIFRRPSLKATWPKTASKKIKCIYVSPVWVYKHQWQVVRAVHMLRQNGYNISIMLLGIGVGDAHNILHDAIKEVDPNNTFVRLENFVDNHKLPETFRQSHLFVFASSCENMPITLLEGMAAGFPIASSDRGPMPEVLKDAGTYFNPEDYQSIASAIELILRNSTLRKCIATKAKLLSDEFSWKRCANETCEYIIKILNQSDKNNVY